MKKLVLILAAAVCGLSAADTGESLKGEYLGFSAHKSFIKNKELHSGLYAKDLIGDDGIFYEFTAGGTLSPTTSNLGIKAYCGLYYNDGRNDEIGLFTGLGIEKRLIDDVPLSWVFELRAGYGWQFVEGEARDKVRIFWKDTPVYTFQGSAGLSYALSNRLSFDLMYVYRWSAYFLEYEYRGKDYHEEFIDRGHGINLGVNFRF